MNKYLFITVFGLCLIALYLLDRTQLFIESEIDNRITSTLVPTNSPTPTVMPTSKPTEKPSDDSEKQPSTSKLPVLNGSAIFGLINSYRASNGKPFWSVSSELCRLAEQRAEYLIQPTYEDFLKNTFPSFKSHPGFQDMANSLNYSGLGLSENLAMGAKSDSDVLNMWKNSAGHNSLMLATDHNGTTYTKACVATRVKYYGSITVLLAGDK